VGVKRRGAAGGYESDGVVGDVDEKYYFTKTRGNRKKQGPECVSPRPSPRFRPNFDDKALSVIIEVLHKYGNLSNAEIKTVVYRTIPMKYLLEQEAMGKDMRKTPVIYKNRISSEIDRERSES